MSKKKPLTFSGRRSVPFWGAVWGYYDMSDKKRRMPAAERFDLLYSYGCRAQELESEIVRLQAVLDEAREKVCGRSPMSIQRYNLLWDHSGSCAGCAKCKLTKEESEAGWHWCPDWDGLIVGPSTPEAECCTCFSSKKVKN